MTVDEARHKVRFNPEINLGHVLSSIAFIGTGVALYVSLVTTMNDLNTWRISIERMNLPVTVQDVALAKQKLEMIEEISDREAQANQKIIEQLADLNAAVAVVRDRLARDDAAVLSR